MSALIQDIFSQGRSLELYGTVCTIGMWVSICYSLYHGWKMGLKIWQIPIVLAVTVLFMSNFQGFIYDYLVMVRDAHFLGIETIVNSIVRVFIFLPLLAVFVAEILRIKWSKVCDAMAMYPLLASGINQLACLFPGCCRGYPCSWGIYNVKIQEYCFPTPILETVLSLGIFAYLVVKSHRKGYVSDGSLYPTMMVLYGAMRFVCELLRDNEKLILGISPVGIHALVLCLSGVAVLFIMKKRAARNGE